MLGIRPRWCIGIGIGRGKSLTCITAVESTTSPIVKIKHREKMRSCILMRIKYCFH